ncbi:precorrin-6y C5,15-methyltransferase (decarboxylating) subunit CbiE [Chitinispirillales bacterium ANBcel5]|uniref:precorrin-6y C5,15-methyltransferase (decarboxylating) subunit CbiE n=1 Tax=Cellulosispirillum alkaliphilum TaxID=3039283 RepID=UPI002A5850D8|nr:precorrin-6y C5,15-methyltransferase (decarboxylating) subunit CbiE [Chitinispirillales bacterium ANBcel5]
MNRGWYFTIAGCGPGSSDYLTQAVSNAVEESEIVVGSRRLCELFTSFKGEIITTSDLSHVKSVIDSARKKGQRVTVLVSGDPMVSSLATPLRIAYPDEYRIVSGISAVQVAAAAVGVDWTSAEILSAHAVTNAVDYDLLLRKGALILLAGNRKHIAWINSLHQALKDSYTLFILKNLTLKTESIDVYCDANITEEIIAGLTILIWKRAKEKQ